MNTTNKPYIDPIRPNVQCGVHGKTQYIAFEVPGEILGKFCLRCLVELLASKLKDHRDEDNNIEL